jgi:DNA ligase (NAD+)
MLTKINELRRLIAHHNHLYYNRQRPVISDAAYDALLAELRCLEERTGEISPGSPAQTVGAPLTSALGKARHFRPMLSLDSSAEEASVQAFFASLPPGCEILLQPKMDGLSVELTYENGVFRRGLTRGNGLEGENVTMNLSAIPEIPQQLAAARPRPPLLVVRGEVYMSLAGFEKLNQSLLSLNQEPFANPRNAAAGTLRQLDHAIAAQRPLRFFPFELVNADLLGFANDYQALQALEQWGFGGIAAGYQLYLRQGLELARERHAWYLRQRENLPFEIDGMVIKVNDFVLRDSLGWRSRSPRWAFAWKFPPRQEVTRVEEIVVQVGRTGKLTPVALLRPVDVGGVTISRATLHNFGELARLGVKAGDQVRLERAGDVIPRVARVEREGGGSAFVAPQTCPVCAAAVVVKGAYHFCPNRLQCPAQLKGALLHYVSRQAMDIEGLGEKKIVQLMEAGLLGSVADIYLLPQKAESLLSLPDWGRLSFDNLCAAIANSKGRSLANFIFALGIDGVGHNTARELQTRFGQWQSFINANEERYAQIEGVGPVVARNIFTFLQDPHSAGLAARLYQLAAPAASTASLNRSWQDAAVVFTGGFKRVSRRQAGDMVIAGGGKVLSGVNQKVTLVVAGAQAGSKLEKARQLKLEIIDEDEFLRRCQRPPEEEDGRGASADSGQR